MAKLTGEQIALAVLEVSDGVIEAVKEGGELGVPGGLLYQPFISRWSATAFDNFMSSLVSSGHLQKRGERYFYRKSISREVLEAVRAAVPIEENNARS